MRRFLGNWFPIFYDRFDCTHDPPLRRFTVDAVRFHERPNGDIDKSNCRFPHRLVRIGLLAFLSHSFPAAR